MAFWEMTYSVPLNFFILKKKKIEKNNVIQELSGG